jgi:transposase-like protein
MKPKTLQDAVKYFSDPENCMNWLKTKRWPDGVPVCPTCGRGDATYLPESQKWQCKSAHKSRQFSARVGTIFEDSPISLEKWLVALWMVCNCKNGISSYEIHRTVGVTQKSAWFMLQRLRLAMQSGSITKLGGSGSAVEMDETFIGGKLKNMHKSKKPKGTGFSGKSVGAMAKTIVVGMLERKGNVRAEVVMDRTQVTLHSLIAKHIAPGSTLMTDEHGGYKGTDFEHEIINHANEYVNGLIHTNGIENFWSLLKRGLNGTYVSVEPFHLFRYIDEQAFRYNNRGGKKRDNRITDMQRFDLALTGSIGKRLTYAEVTGKVSPTCY